MPPPPPKPIPWVSMKEKKPKEYELVEVLFEDGETQHGWLSSGKWDFGRRKTSSPVKLWRSMTGHHNQFFKSKKK